MTNTSTALNVFNEKVNYGFAYANKDGSIYIVTQQSLYIIGAVAIATITAIGFCCTRWCTKHPESQHTINVFPKVEKSSPKPSQTFLSKITYYINKLSIPLINLTSLTVSFIGLMKIIKRK